MHGGKKNCLLLICALLILTGMWYISPAEKTDASSGRYVTKVESSVLC